MSKAKRPGRTAPRPWQPLRPAHRVPLSEEQIQRLREQGLPDDVREQMEQEEMWMNDIYVVSCTRREDGSVHEISIRRRDRKAARDWRDFQQIKNEIAGPEVEAVELYPAMSRIMDTANQYYLWCLPPGMPMPFGYRFPRANLRNAADQKGTNAVQRELPDDWAELAGPALTLEEMDEANRKLAEEEESLVQHDA